MSAFAATVWLAKEAHVRSNGEALFVYPGAVAEGYLGFQFGALSPAERVRVADEVLAGVRAWRDAVVAGSGAGTGVAS